MWFFKKQSVGAFDANIEREKEEVVKAYNLVRKKLLKLLGQLRKKTGSHVEGDDSAHIESDKIKTEALGILDEIFKAVEVAAVDNKKVEQDSAKYRDILKNLKKGDNPKAQEMWKKTSDALTKEIKLDDDFRKLMEELTRVKSLLTGISSFPVDKNVAKEIKSHVSEAYTILIGDVGPLLNSVVDVLDFLRDEMRELEKNLPRPHETQTA
jgi:hypothetical protein